MNYRNEFIALTLAAVGFACGPSVSTEAEPGRETGSCVEHECLGDLVCLSDLCVDPFATPTGGEDSSTSGADSDDTDVGPRRLDSVSILVVVDNSGSMGEEQQAVATALAGLPEALDAEGIDWRIGITTTDNGNPWCPGTGPEAGSLVFSSCRSRLDGFLFEGAQTIDASEACTDICPEEWGSIQTEPSSIEGGGAVASRPWVESIDGQTNLPPMLSPADAMRCLVPQGINGCGFEQPLESMHKALDRSGLDSEDAYGFLPDGALLVVLIVSDEADCSYNDAHESIFLPDGDRVFWSDENTAAPTSAVCWNAGTQCGVEDCMSADFDAQGNAVAAVDADSDAVLRPLSRYVDRLREVEVARVMLLTGVDSDGNAVYQSGIDPVYEDNFGIAPGCEGPGGPAVPPVRMREFADRFTDGGSRNNMYSICEGSHDAAMAALVSSIADLFS